MSRSAGRYDAIIVGGGPAGCVLAWRLSADPSRRVLLLEAGAIDRSVVGRLRTRFTNWPGPGRVWPYATVSQPALDGRCVYLPQGRTLGGGSAVNAMTYVRGRPDDYEAWNADGWSPAEVLEAFKRIEGCTAIHDSWHGTEGPLTVSDQVRPHALSRAFVEAAAAIGVPRTRDFNGGVQEGVGFYHVTQRGGRRLSAADAFLRPALGRANLTVLTGAAATRVRIDHGCATGVEFRHGGQTRVAEAAGEVLVSGGAINSPKLLLLSGIGPADDLRRLDIPVVTDLPGVGANLHDHLNVQLILRSRDSTTYDHWTRPDRFIRFGLEFMLFNRGLAVSTLCEAGAFLRSRSSIDLPDVQLHFLPLMWRDYGRAPTEGHGVTLEAAHLQPASRGRVALSSSDPAAAPLIDPHYCADPADLEALVDALLRCREIAAARPMTERLAGERYPGIECRTREALAAYVRATAVTAYHPVGTCRMGRARDAVVDERLCLHGVERLRVIDSSIMPRIVSGSTQAPSMMIGEMGAAMVLADGG